MCIMMMFMCVCVRCVAVCVFAFKVIARVRFCRCVSVQCKNECVQRIAQRTHIFV